LFIFLSVQSNLADFIAIGFHGEPQKGSQRKSGSSAVGFCKDGFPGHRECMFSFQYPSCLDFESFVLLAEMFGYWLSKTADPVNTQRSS
jgi:hypothetical protein